jgi:hypothetical protein
MRLVLLSVLAASTALAAPPKLVMKGHDAAEATYADKCSNGANSEPANRDAFIAKMLADKESTLAKAKAKLEEKDFEVVLDGWTQTFHLREGCSDTSMSYSAFLIKRSTMGNSHEVTAFAVVTIDDDVTADKRTLKLRAIAPMTSRTQP